MHYSNQTQNAAIHASYLIILNQAFWQYIAHSKYKWVIQSLHFQKLSSSWLWYECVHPLMYRICNGGSKKCMLAHECYNYFTLLVWGMWGYCIQMCTLYAALLHCMCRISAKKVTLISFCGPFTIHGIMSIQLLSIQNIHVYNWKHEHLSWSSIITETLWTSHLYPW